MANTARHPIIILDFGSQYTQLIGRRIRELGVYCVIHPFDTKHLMAMQPCGIILSGGSRSIVDKESPQIPDWVFSSRLPVLGICYGMQAMAVQLGGEVIKSSVGEFGYAELRMCRFSKLFMHIDAKLNKDMHEFTHRSLNVWMSHGDVVSLLPPNFELICTTNNSLIAGMADESRQWYGLQFHPEVTHTAQGLQILQGFVIDICCAKTDWNCANIITEAIKSIRLEVANDKVLLGISGGVDSAVVAALLRSAIAEQLVCVFVDTGLLRLNEAAQVVLMFQQIGIEIIVVEAANQFLQALINIDCPERKRKIIGKTFIEIFEAEARRIQGIRWLAQGTIYPDVIESISLQSTEMRLAIKSHHNVGGLPLTMQLKLLEPIRALFKDEVRKIGIELGLPYDMVYRHPFPGPGLGVRIIGEIKSQYIQILRHADAIFIDELRLHGLYQKVSQAFAVFLPVKSVGVMGDARRYDYVICLRAVETIDFMTAQWAHLPWEFLDLVSNRIINEVDGVARVVYDISGKPPSTIEWE